MEALKTILRFLDTQANMPKYLGVFHIVWIALAIAASVALCILWQKGVIKKVNKFVLIASLVVLALGLYKQVVLSFGYDPTLTFNYDFNNFPWHFATVPFIVGIFMGATSGRINNHFQSYLATFGLLAGVWEMFQPNAFVSTVGLNIYSMICSVTMIALAVLVIYSQEVKLEIKTYFNALPVFAMMVGIAISFNELANLISTTQNISMFSIDRHSPSTAPVYSYVHNAFLATGDTMTLVEYVLCVIFYFTFTSLCALALFGLIIGTKKLLTTDFDAEYEKNDSLALGLRKSEGLDDEENQEIFTFKNKVNSKKNTYMKTYFENLQTNFGNNNKGSCGYVATAMLLSYYDTVLNEKIVPRQFDEPSLSHNTPDFQNSPGIKFYHPAFNPNEISYRDYITDINKRKNSYLHECLLALAIDKNLNDAPKDKASTDFDFGSSAEDTKIVLKRYFKTIANIKKSEYDIRIQDNTDEIQKAKDVQEIAEYSNEIRSYTIKKIKKGFPVLLGVYNTNGGAHAVIAYDYDKKEDKIYCHSGNFSIEQTYTHITPEELGYNIYGDALVLDFDERKISRTHTDNYEVVIDGALFYYCLDGRYTTPDDLVVEFGTDKQCLSITGVYSKYPKEKLIVPECYGNVPVTNIAASALQNQRHIQEVVLSCNIPTISKKTFEDCRSLKTIVLPASIKKIGRKAFADCRNLTSIMFLGTKAEWMAIKKRGAWDKKTGNYRVYCVDGVLTKLIANGQSELL